MSELVSTIMTNARRVVLPSALAMVLVGAPLSLTAHAAGDDDAEPTCRKGLVWDKKKQMCIPVKAGVISDDALADYAHALSREERFQEALDVLALVKNQNNAKVLNYRGYATRNLGRVDEGIRYYHQALALDSENVLVRNYLGLAYVKKGEISKARALLGEIGDRCGTECKEYVDLAAAIKAAT
jgi:tetratricopeptide (TPR) repeat protein